MFRVVNRAGQTDCRSAPPGQQAIIRCLSPLIPIQRSRMLFMKRTLLLSFSAALAFAPFVLAQNRPYSLKTFGGGSTIDAAGAKIPAGWPLYVTAGTTLRIVVERSWVANPQTARITIPLNLELGESCFCPLTKGPERLILLGSSAKPRSWLRSSHR